MDSWDYSSYWDWYILLNDENGLVLIVILRCKDWFHLDLDPLVVYKVIRCDTILDVWS